jgi:hypothetical protein
MSVIDPFTSAIMNGMADTSPLQRTPAEVVAAVDATPSWTWYIIGAAGVAVALFFLYRWLTAKPVPAAAPPAAAPPAGEPPAPPQ